VSSRILKPLSFAVAIAIGLSACAKKEEAAPVAVEAAKPLSIDFSKLPQLPAFNAADLDQSSPICVDLNKHVNGKWLAANPVPSDRTTWGSFEMLGERSLAVQKQIVEAASTSKPAIGNNEQNNGQPQGAGKKKTREISMNGTTQGEGDKTFSPRGAKCHATYESKKK